ncbi:MAG: CapA family protein [Alistipes sp.]|nr:CapA family protein [Alistipes sp.]
MQHVKNFVATTYWLLCLLAFGLCCRHAMQPRVSASAEAEAAPTRAEMPRQARLLFVGDLMMHKPQLTAARTGDGYDFSRSFRWLRQRFAEADAVIVNLETTLSDAGPYTGYPLFRSPVAVAGAMADAGVNIAVLANNHCCDGGAKGIRTTLEALDRVGIAHTGMFCDSAGHRARHPLYFEAGGIRFALLNYTYGTNGMPVPAGCTVNRIDTLRIGGDLAALDRDRAECVIAFMHWGNEYQRRPDRHQRELAAFLRRRGVTLVIGSHPHVVQPFERQDGDVVFYSLGNFLSNQRKRYCNGGMLAAVEVTAFGRDSLVCVPEAIPVWVMLPGYEALPPEVGDTLSMPPHVRSEYEEFRRDFDAIVG